MLQGDIVTEFMMVGLQVNKSDNNKIDSTFRIFINKASKRSTLIFRKHPLTAPGGDLSWRPFKVKCKKKWQIENQTYINDVCYDTNIHPIEILCYILVIFSL